MKQPVHVVMRAVFLIIVLECGRIVCLSQTAEGQKFSLYVTNETEKIAQTDRSIRDRIGIDSLLWDGKTITLHGARNEVVGFQLILTAPTRGMTDVSVTLDSLSGRRYTIKNLPRTGSAIVEGDRMIELFKEAYLDIFRRTDDASVWWGGARPSDYYKGRIPDGLIPFGVGKEKGGSPFDIAPMMNQGVWVDITIPRTAPAGDYTGEVVIREGGRELSKNAIRLHVYDFTLSDTTHFRNIFFASSKGIGDKHGVSLYSPAYYRIEAAYHRLAHRHRMNLSFNQTIDSLAAHSAGFYTGAAYRSESGYYGPGYGVGNNAYGIGIYDQPNQGAISGFQDTTAAGWSAASRRWMAWFRANAPGTLIFRYMIDEPDSSRYGLIRRRAQWLHRNGQDSERLRTFCTTRIDTRLFGSVDIWGLTGQSGYVPADKIPSGPVVKEIRERQRQGEMVALYNGTRPGFGAVQVIDADAADARINPWIAWKYHVDMYFLWHVNYYFQDARKINPWADNYREYDKRICWGTGTFLYPGEDKEFPEADRGIAGALPSIRMKNWRRGMQDYEYLWLARQAGLTKDVQEAVDAIVPAALDECPQGQNAQPPWAIRGERFEQARIRLAEALESANNR